MQNCLKNKTSQICEASLRGVGFPFLLGVPVALPATGFLLPAGVPGGCASGSSVAVLAAAAEAFKAATSAGVNRYSESSPSRDTSERVSSSSCSAAGPTGFKRRAGT